MAKQGSSRGTQANLRSLIQQEMAQMQSQGDGTESEIGESSQDEDLRQLVRQELRAMKDGGRSNHGGQSGHRNTGQTTPAGNVTGGTSSSPNNASRASGGSSKHGSGSQSSASSVGESSSSHHNKKAKIKPKMNADDSQTVAQVLTQAQYELSQELEANLKKLRSVIQQSEEIAKKIELVLGRGEQGSGTKE